MRILFCFILTMLASPIAYQASAQAPPQSPGVRAFGDNKFWIVLEDMRYVIGSTQDQIIVPKGFVTDFASIPRELWSLGLSPHGRYSRAAIVHDYLYWSQGCSREQADRLLLLAMKESSVGTFDQVLVYQGVNVGGKSSWDANAAERRRGLPRVVPDQYQRPEDPNVSWPDYRQMLVSNQIKDPNFPMDPQYCRHGDSSEVPR
jgi:hypothetical protein